MHILCPHCQSPVEIVRLDPRADIPCPSCGSSFRVEAKPTAAWFTPEGQRLDRHGALGTVRPQCRPAPLSVHRHRA